MFFPTLTGMLANIFYSQVFSDFSMFQTGGTLAIVFTIALFLVAVFLWLYARRMVGNGMLK